ncbi:MdtA/MuxA family multidrug efflux RND transporter periplasmic adaptor subunit [soil metagenome]
MFKSITPTAYYRIVMIIIAAVLILITLHACSKQHSETRSKRNANGNRPIPVLVATARIGAMPVYLAALGSVVPTYNVTIKTQVNGRLLRVLYREGQMVKAGELLAEIDPSPFQAQVTQFEGQLLRDQALLANAKVDLKRYKGLVSQHAAPQQQYETQTWLVKQLEGTVKSDQGQLDAARVNLAYCRVVAPVAGRVGLRLVDPGNFVQTSDVNGLVVITTLNPITVVFTLPEDNIAQVMQQLNAGRTLQTEAYDRTQNKLLALGTLLTIDNQIDATTGTVKLKALFNNDRSLLFPNQFVNVRLLVDTLRNVTLVPTTAIQRGAKGTYVYLVNKNQTVSVKPITVRLTLNDTTAISAGVLPGQQIVVEGSDKLTDGSKVSLPNTLGQK